MPRKKSLLFDRLLSTFRTDDSCRLNGQPMQFAIEDLEARLLLTGSGFIPVPTIDAAVVSVSAPDTLAASDRVYSNAITRPADDVSQLTQAAIQSVTLRVNGEQVVVTNNFDTLRLSPGETLEVVSVNYDVHESINVEGIMVAEGYISKLDSGELAATPDYADGRFTARDDAQAVAVGSSVLNGLEGDWVVEEGSDRLSIALIHYFGDEFARMSTFAIRLQVGDPDFSVDPSVTEQFSGRELRAGEEFAIFGSWANQGQGYYHNYSEVDIFDANTGEVVWVGVTVGNTSEGDAVAGEYLNTNPNDAFSTRWTPELAGEYVIHFHADPEKSWRETNEENNLIEICLDVEAEEGSLVANGDSYSGMLRRDFRKMDLLANDQGEGLKLAQFTQGENGRVRLEWNGTLRYIPNRDFVGMDQFTYTVMDAAGNSETATVMIEVLGKGVKVTKPIGEVGEPVDLVIDLDTERYQAVLIKGVPRRGATLSAGERQPDGSYIVQAADLEGLQMTSRRELRSKRMAFFGIENGEVVRHSRVLTRAKVLASADGVDGKVGTKAQLARLEKRVVRKVERLVKKLAKSNTGLLVTNLPASIKVLGAESVDGGYLITADNVKNLDIVFDTGVDWKSILRDSTKLGFEEVALESSKPGKPAKKAK